MSDKEPGQKMAEDTTLKLTEAQQALQEAQDKVGKGVDLGHRLSTALQTLEWNVSKMLEKGRVDTQLNEKVLKGILAAPGGRNILEQLATLGKQVSELEGTLYAKDKLDINKPGLLSGSLRTFVEKVPTFLATQQTAKPGVPSGNRGTVYEELRRTQTGERFKED